MVRRDLSRSNVSDFELLAPVAFSNTSKNVAETENILRLILLAMRALDSFSPCFFGRSVGSRCPTPARGGSALRNGFASFFVL
jgi:hypothetical protein